MERFEDKFMEVQASMISLALEYVQNQAEKVYIYCVSEDDLLTNSLKSKYSYEGRYDKDEELSPQKEFEKWFEEVKESQE